MFNVAKSKKGLEMKLSRIKFGAFVAAATLLSACGSAASSTSSASGSAATSSSTVKTVSALMNYYASATQAGFFYANKLGLYAKQGLKVTLVQSSGSQTTAELVGSGKYNIGYADGPTAMQAISKGANDIIVAPIIQTTSQSIVSLASSGITSISQLAGKSVGVGAGTVGAAVLPVILKANGVNPASVKATVVSSSTPPLPLLEAGTINAFLGAQDLQDVELQLEGAKINVIPFSKVGGGFLGTSIIVNKTYFQKHPNTVKKFIAGSLAGWAAAKANPSAAAASIKAAVSTAGSSQLLTAGTKADVALLCYTGAKTLGNAPIADWNFTYKVLSNNGFISKSSPVSSYYTTAAISSSAPAC